jgi:hypothetical protein
MLAQELRTLRSSSPRVYTLANLRSPPRVYTLSNVEQPSSGLHLKNVEQPSSGLHLENVEQPSSGLHLGKLEELCISQQDCQPAGPGAALQSVQGGLLGTK